MKIDLDQVQHVALLARLRIDGDQARTLTDQLNRILDYMDKLNELDTTGLDPLAHPIPLPTPLRDDRIRPSLNPEDALANAPQRQDTFFLVPKIL
jgi:aspartyl-tRNA(Asn)/glutamyl-tRNA(Gln) amidotransferase subunit C